MARQNYGHEKRQRELAKKQKREKKMAQRLEKKNAPEDGTAPDPALAPEGTGETPEGGTGPAGSPA